MIEEMFEGEVDMGDGCVGVGLRKSLRLEVWVVWRVFNGVRYG